MQAQQKFTPTTLVSLVGDRLEGYGKKSALTFQGKTTSYAELRKQIDRAAEGFQKAGIKKGDTVGLFLPNTPDFPVAFHGALKAGAKVTAFNCLFEPEQLKHQILDSGAKTLITMDSPMLLPTVMEILDQTPLENVVVGKTADLLPFAKKMAVKASKPITRFHDSLSEGTKSLLDRVKLVSKFFKAMKEASKLTVDIPNDNRISLLSNTMRNSGRPEAVDIQPDDIAVLQYTGGTTGGKPKAAMLSQNNIASNIQQGLAILPDFEVGTERMLGALPLFHIFGNAMMNLGLHKGAHIYLHPKATDIDDVSKLINDSQATFMAGTPALYDKLAGAATKNGHDYTSLKFAISGGDALPLSTSERFAQVAPCGIRSGYGMSESPVVCVMPQGTKYEKGLAGQIIPGTEIKIIDPASGKEVEAGQEGEIVVHGPQVTSGYMGQDDVNAKVITAEGGFRTGDLGKVVANDDGTQSLYITGRLKNVIIRGGHNIYPEEIDGIENHAQVAETCTFGVPSADKGEFVATLIRLKDGEQANEATIASVLEHIAENVGSFERPNFISFVDDIPKTKIMKLDRNEAIRRVKDGELELNGVDFKAMALKANTYRLPSDEPSAAVAATAAAPAPDL